MRAVKWQFFLSYAVIGSLAPFMPIYLAGLGFDRGRIGNVMAAGSVATVLSPVMVTLLADASVEGRKLMAGLFVMAGAALGLLLGVQGFLPVMTIWMLHSLAIRPTLPLQDGINFTIQQRRKMAGEPEAPYHKIRVWGTVGYTLPGFALFWLFRFWEGKTWVCVVFGIGMSVIGLVNALLLPREVSEKKDHSRMPTAEAGRRMLEKPLFVYCVAMFILNMAAQGFYVPYPTYLKERLGLSNGWIGMISNLGVAVEFFFVLGFGRLVRRFGLKTVILVGIGAMFVRMVLLAAIPTVAVGAGTQLLHGAMVLTTGIAPPMFMNRHADDRYRNSIQGMYTMAVTGAGAVVGALLAGWISKAGYERVFWWSAVMSVVSGVLIAVAFAEEHTEELEKREVA